MLSSLGSCETVLVPNIISKKTCNNTFNPRNAQKNTPSALPQIFFFHLGRSYVTTQNVFKEVQLQKNISIVTLLPMDLGRPGCTGSLGEELILDLGQFGQMHEK